MKHLLYIIAVINVCLFTSCKKDNTQPVTYPATYADVVDTFNYSNYNHNYGDSNAHVNHTREYVSVMMRYIPADHTIKFGFTGLSDITMINHICPGCKDFKGYLYFKPFNGGFDTTLTATQEHFKLSYANGYLKLYYTSPTDTIYSDSCRGSGYNPTW